MSGSISQGQGVTATLPITTGYYPPEGSRALSASYSWMSTVRQYNEDLSGYVQAGGGMQVIQSVFIDNSLVEFPVTLLIRGTNQRFVVPGGAMGCFPAFFTAGARYSIAGITTTGEGSVGNNVNDNITSVIWMNVPCQFASTWSATGGGGLMMGARTSGIIADPGSTGLLTTFPTDCRMVVASVSVAVSFSTPPTAAGTVKVAFNDVNRAIAEGRLGFVAGQPSASLTFSGLNYLARAVGSSMFVTANTFPTGAAGAELTTSTLYTLIPLIIGG